METTDIQNEFYEFCMNYSDEKLAAFLGREYLLECCVNRLHYSFDNNILEAKNDLINTKTERAKNGR